MVSGFSSLCKMVSCGGFLCGEILSRCFKINLGVVRSLVSKQNRTFLIYLTLKIYKVLIIFYILVFINIRVFVILYRQIDILCITQS